MILHENIVDRTHTLGYLCLIQHFAQVDLDAPAHLCHWDIVGSSLEWVLGGLSYFVHRREQPR